MAAKTGSFLPVLNGYCVFLCVKRFCHEKQGKFTGFSPEKREGGAFLLLFTVKDEVGGLAKAINLISAYNFNMKVLRSRPMKDLPWHYYFYAEVEGNADSENGRRMISALKGACPMVKVAGHFISDQQV